MYQIHLGRLFTKKILTFTIKLLKTTTHILTNKKSNWDNAKSIYQPYIDTCSSRNSFIQIIEKTLNELYNGNNFLNTNTD